MKIRPGRRGALALPENGNPLIRQLFESMNERMVTVPDLAEKSGLGRSTISGWRYNREPRISDLEAALNCIGLKLEIGEAQP